MANIFYTVTNIATAFAQALNQLVNGFNGTSDIGDIIAYPQITPLPGALTATAGATGSLTGAYSYQVTYVTGLVDGTGALHIQGETTVGTASTTVNPSAQNVALMNIPIGPTGVIARSIYRTKAGGSIYYFDFQISDNITTSWTDTTADTSLVTVVPATNTTGSRFLGNASGLNNIQPSALPIATTTVAGIVKGSTSVLVAGDGKLTTTPASVGAIPTSAEGAANGVATLDSASHVPSGQLPNASTSAMGGVEVAASPTSGTPIASSRVATASEVLIAVITSQTVAAYTPTAQGNFEVRVSFRVVTGTANVTIAITYTSSTGAQTYTPISVKSCAIGDYNISPFTFNSVSGSAISIQVTASVANQVYASGGITGV